MNHRHFETTLISSKLPSGGGSKCEVISLDARSNKKGDWEIKPSTAPIDTEKARDGEWDEYAITYTRHFDQEGKMSYSKMVVRSPHMLEALKAVVGYYPGAPIITEKKVTYTSPYTLLYHCLNDLKKYRENLSDNHDVAKLHINLLITVVRNQYEGELEELKTLLPANKITFNLAWVLFRPETVVFTHQNGAPEAYRTYSVSYEKIDGKPYMFLHGKQVDYDGIEFRRRERVHKIPHFVGVADISSLPIYPLSYHSKAEAIHQFLVDRGHRWFNLQRKTPKMMQCDGVCVSKDSRPDRLKKLTTFGRIVVDNRMYDIINNSNAPALTIREAILELISRIDRDKESIKETKENSTRMKEIVNLNPDGQLSDETAALCTAFVRGYSLNKRVWGAFEVSSTKEIHWSPNAFEQLILREESKEAIMALVQAYVDTPRENITQDLVQGKGLGMIFLLHGPPGVGKTLTAETIAEHIKRPLYVVSGGELGSTAIQVEASLSRVLDVAAAWKAVVLIDEADVFLQQRDLTNMERNSLVSVFLRQLEYYEGLMFLTTNRADCIDDAFKSRIDIAVHYPELSERMRARLWESSLKSLDPTSLDLDLDAIIPELSKENMNGREIRKVIKSARLMATYYDKGLNIGHIRTLMGFRMIGSLPEMIDDSDRPGGAKRQRVE